VGENKYKKGRGNLVPQNPFLYNYIQID